jgi:hypothetical protein
MSIEGLQAFFMVDRQITDTCMNVSSSPVTSPFPLRRSSTCLPGNSFRGRELALHLRGSEGTWAIEEAIYGKDGLDHVEARVAGMVREAVPPRLVVYPSGDGK